MDADAYVTYHGSITVLVPVSEAANAWCDEHLPGDALMWGQGYVVEPRYLIDIVDGMAGDGLLVES